MRFARGRGNPLASQPIAHIAEQGSGTAVNRGAAEKRSLQVSIRLTVTSTRAIVSRFTKGDRVPETMTLREVQTKTGLSTQGIYYIIKTGLLRARKLRGRWTVTPEALAAYESKKLGLINREDVEARKNAK